MVDGITYQYYRTAVAFVMTTEVLIGTTAPFVRAKNGISDGRTKSNILEQPKERFYYPRLLNTAIKAEGSVPYLDGVLRWLCG